MRRLLEQLVAEGAGRHELIAWAPADWCRLAGTGTIHIEPGSPWENPYVESFNGRARDELLNVEEFGSLAEASVIVEAWRMEYNTYRPHSALGGLTPAEYRARWEADNQIAGTPDPSPDSPAPLRAS